MRITKWVFRQFSKREEKKSPTMSQQTCQGLLQIILGASIVHVRGLNILCQGLYISKSISINTSTGISKSKSICISKDISTSTTKVV